MAGPLTWKNVDAPSDAAGNNLIINSLPTLTQGLSKVNNVFKDIAADRTAQETETFLNQLRSMTPEQIQVAQASGELDRRRAEFNNLDPTKTGFDGVEAVRKGLYAEQAAERQRLVTGRTQQDADEAYNLRPQEAALQEALNGTDPDRSKVQEALQPFVGTALHTAWLKKAEEDRVADEQSRQTAEDRTYNVKKRGILDDRETAKYQETVRKNERQAKKDGIADAALASLTDANVRAAPIIRDRAINWENEQTAQADLIKADSDLRNIYDITVPEQKVAYDTAMAELENSWRTPGDKLIAEEAQRTISALENDKAALINPFDRAILAGESATDALHAFDANQMAYLVDVFGGRQELFKIAENGIVLNEATATTPETRLRLPPQFFTSLATGTDPENWFFKLIGKDKAEISIDDIKNNKGLAETLNKQYAESQERQALISNQRKKLASLGSPFGSTDLSGGNTNTGGVVQPPNPDQVIQENATARNNFVEQASGRPAVAAPVVANPQDPANVAAQLAATTPAVAPTDELLSPQVQQVLEKRAPVPVEVAPEVQRRGDINERVVARAKENPVVAELQTQLQNIVDSDDRKYLKDQKIMNLRKSVQNPNDFLRESELQTDITEFLKSIDYLDLDDLDSPITREGIKENITGFIEALLADGATGDKKVQRTLDKDAAARLDRILKAQ